MLPKTNPELQPSAVVDVSDSSFFWRADRADTGTVGVWDRDSMHAGIMFQITDRTDAFDDHGITKWHGLASGRSKQPTDEESLASTITKLRNRIKKVHGHTMSIGHADDFQATPVSLRLADEGGELDVTAYLQGDDFYFLDVFGNPSNTVHTATLVLNSTISCMVDPEEAEWFARAVSSMALDIFKTGTEINIYGALATEGKTRCIMLHKVADSTTNPDLQDIVLYGAGPVPLRAMFLPLLRSQGLKGADWLGSGSGTPRSLTTDTRFNHTVREVMSKVCPTDRVLLLPSYMDIKSKIRGKFNESNVEDIRNVLEELSTQYTNTELTDFVSKP